MRIKIERLDDNGNGIGYINDKIVFVPNTLPTEEVEIEILKETKKYYKAKVINYLKESNKRIISKCPYYNECGGCNLLHLNYSDTLDYKKEKIINVFNKFANIKLKNIEVIKSDYDYNYRNKISLKVINKKIGFYKNESHDLVEVDNCLIAKKSINNTIKLINRLNIINGEVTIRSNYNDEIIIIISSFDKINFDIKDFKSIKLVGVILNNKKIYGESFFIEKIEDFYFRVSYNSFFQINNNILDKVFKILNDNIDNTDNLLDLYCGVGVLGISVSNKCKSIIGIEIVENSIKNALINIKMNKLDNINYLLGDTTKVINNINKKFDTILIDPPRSGLNTQTLNYIKNNKPNRIIYMSCDPVTLCRDIKDIDYNVDNVYILDMFPYTKHVECVCVLKVR